MLTIARITFVFMAFSLFIFVFTDESLKLIQQKCKIQNAAVRDKEMLGEDNCPEYKELVKCIAKVNFTAVNYFVNDHKPPMCKFTDEDIKNLQKYSFSTQPTPTTTEVNTAAGLTMMPVLIGITIILQAVF